MSNNFTDLKKAMESTGLPVTRDKAVKGTEWLYKIPEQEMESAFNALTPLILQEGLVIENAETDAKQDEVEG